MNKLKLDFHNCSSQDTTIALCLMMTLVLINFFIIFFFTQHVITRISSRVPLYCIVIDQINKLPEDGLKFSPERSRYIENTWISGKIKIKLYFSYTLLIRHNVTDGALIRLLMATKVRGWKQTHSFAHSLRSSPIAKT